MRLGRRSGFGFGSGSGKPTLADGREIKAGGRDYLLTPMRKQELSVMDEVLDRARDAVEAVLMKGVERGDERVQQELVTGADGDRSVDVESMSKMRKDVDSRPDRQNRRAGTVRSRTSQKEVEQNESYL